MKNIEKINEIILLFSKYLNSKKYNWILGGSGGLMVQGINIIPNDVDIFIDKKYLNNIYDDFYKFVIIKIADYKWNNIEYKKFKLSINDIEIEIIELPENRKNIQKVNYKKQSIPVNYLKDELNFYKLRPEKSQTVKLIQEKLKEETN